jgi:hypothetical protein
MEWKRVNTLCLVVAVLLGLAPATLAQRGMGDATGVVRQGLKPEIVTLQGKVVRIITGPCKQTTGQADIGTHFILKLKQGPETNIHLGPAHLVQGVTDGLASGGTVSVTAFRTEKMPKANYNAVTVTVGNKTLRLRNPNLRPVWAGQALVNSHGETVNNEDMANVPAQGQPYQSAFSGPRSGRGNARMKMAWGQGRGRDFRCGWRYRCNGRPQYGMRRGGRW